MNFKINIFLDNAQTLMMKHTMGYYQSSLINENCRSFIEFHKDDKKIDNLNDILSETFYSFKFIPKKNQENLLYYIFNIENGKMKISLKDNNKMQIEINNATNLKVNLYKGYNSNIGVNNQEVLNLDIAKIKDQEIIFDGNFETFAKFNSNLSSNGSEFDKLKYKQFLIKWKENIQNLV